MGIGIGIGKRMGIGIGIGIGIGTGIGIGIGIGTGTGIGIGIGLGRGRMRPPCNAAAFPSCRARPAERPSARRIGVIRREGGVMDVLLYCCMLSIYGGCVCLLYCHGCRSRFIASIMFIVRAAGITTCVMLFVVVFICVVLVIYAYSCWYRYCVQGGRRKTRGFGVEKASSTGGDDIYIYIYIYIYTHTYTNTYVYIYIYVLLFMYYVYMCYLYIYIYIYVLYR